MARLRHIFISPGHNYFGHHGRPAGAHPLYELPRAECVAGHGLRGDRFFDQTPNYKGQVTLFAFEVFAEMRAVFGAALESPAAFRRNLITEGLNLTELIGHGFALQGVELEGVEECRPCYWMDQAVGPGAEDWLRGRGGLRCRVLAGGWLRQSAA